MKDLMKEPLFPVRDPCEWNRGPAGSFPLRDRLIGYELRLYYMLEVWGHVDASALNDHVAQTTGNSIRARQECVANNCFILIENLKMHLDGRAADPEFIASLSLELAEQLAWLSLLAVEDDVKRSRNWREKGYKSAKRARKDRPMPTKKKVLDALAAEERRDKYATRRQTENAKAAARKLGISLSTLYNIKKGKQKPSELDRLRDEAKRIANAAVRVMKNLGRKS